MQDEPTRAGLPDEPAHTERIVLTLLLEGGHAWPWSLTELLAEAGHEVLVMDAVIGLCAAGLVHRTGEFVFPSRPATRFAQISTA